MELTKNNHIEAQKRKTEKNSNYNFLKVRKINDLYFIFSLSLNENLSFMFLELFITFLFPKECFKILGAGNE